MQYKAFISYKSEDRAWALKLKRSLEARGVRELFYDKDRLEAGYSWPTQLSQALADSQHIVLLYSKRAYAPESFVSFEHWEFHSKYYEAAEKDPTLPRRKMIYVLLDTNPPPTTSMLHAISALKDSDAGKEEGDTLYFKGADHLADDDAVWRSVVDQVERALTEDEAARPVGCFILAARRKDFERRDFGEVVGPTSLATILNDLGVTKDAFLERYGEHAEDWRPFGDDRKIFQRLEALGDQINGRLAASAMPEVAGLRIRLRLPNERFWSEDARLRDAEIASWRNQLLVIVIDPLSLYVRSVATRLAVLPRLLTSGLATVMVLGTRPAPPENAFLRELLRSEASMFHQIFCEPELPLFEPQPLGGVNINENEEMQRLLVTTVGGFLRANGSSAKARADLITMART